MPRKWTYGVTTIPLRRRDLLPATLASLKDAGFDRPHLFVDGATHEVAASYEQEFGLAVTAHWPILRVHGNWVLSLYELYIRSPEAERFAIFQDDILCCKNLRAHLDRCSYPDGPVAPRDGPTPGYWNLYTAPSNQELAKDSIGWYESNQQGKGALALVFSRQAVITLLSAQHLVERPCDQQRGWRSVDGGIVDSFRKAGWKEYCHNPSLVLHTGVYSSFDKRKQSTGEGTFTPERWPDHYNQTSFPGVNFDCLTLLTGQTAAEPLESTRG